MHGNAKRRAPLSVVEASVRPSAIERAGRIRHGAFSVRFAIQECAIVARLAGDQHALSMGQAVQELPFILAAGPGLRPLAGLPPGAPLALVALILAVASEPVESAFAIGKTVLARPAPARCLAGGWLRVPNLAACLGVSDPIAREGNGRCAKDEGGYYAKAPFFAA